MTSRREVRRGREGRCLLGVLRRSRIRVLQRRGGSGQRNSSTKGDSSLALTVVHTFTEPARIAFRCVGLGSIVRHVKITAIRVDVLKNVYVEAG